MKNTGDRAEQEPLTLVLTATGKTGRRVVDRLKERGVPTRRGSRSGKLPFDWDDPTTWEPVLVGVDAAYVVYTPDLAVPAAPTAIRDFTELAVRSGVRRLVLLSGRGEDEAQRCERIVQDCGGDWTIVRASCVLNMGETWVFICTTDLSEFLSAGDSLQFLNTAIGHAMDSLSFDVTWADGCVNSGDLLQAIFCDMDEQTGLQIDIDVSDPFAP